MTEEGRQKGQTMLRSCGLMPAPKRSRRGIALITVLMVSGVVVAFIFGGLSMATQHLFQVSSTHLRNRALCAAEAGIYAARYRLEQDMTFQGTVAGSLPQDEASYNAEVTRQGPLAEVAVVGRCGASVRRLKVKLSLDPDSFNAMGTDGKILIDKYSFINGVRGYRDPRSARGNIHTNSTANDALKVNGPPPTGGPGGRLSVTGTASALGGIVGDVDGRTANEGSISSLKQTKADLLAGTFPGTMIPSDGVVTENTVIPGRLDMAAPLNIPEGVTVHVQGDVVLHQGVIGKGTLVVDGNAVVRGAGGMQDNNGAGVLLYVDGDMALANPRATFDGTDWNAPVDPVGHLFAQMPEDIPYILAQRLPLGAPDGPAFFAWYEQNRQNPSPAFRQWLNGDGTIQNPGISQSARDWLDLAGPMAANLAGGQ